MKNKNIHFKFMDFMDHHLIDEDINLNDSESIYDLHVMVEDMAETIMTFRESNIEWFLKFIILELIQYKYERNTLSPEKNIEKFTNEILSKLFSVETIESVIKNKISGKI